MQKDCNELRNRERVTPLSSYSAGFGGLCCQKTAFTLAEMMVVMLILTIVLAAFAPMMTKRKTVDLSNPWRYATNNSDAYFGLATKQTALIGKNSKNSSDLDSKLLINTLDSSQAHITFSSSGTKRGQLYINSSSLLLGGPSNEILYGISGTTGVGYGTFGAGKIDASSNTAVGTNALYNLGEGSNNTAIGRSALYNNTSGYQNTATGYNSLYNNKTGIYNTAAGNQSLYNNLDGGRNTAVGYQAMYDNASGSYNTAIGYTALASLTTGTNNTAIGLAACQNVTSGSNKTCIGPYSGPESESVDAASDTNILYLGTSSTIVHIPGRLVVDGSVALARKHGNRVWIRTDSFDGKRESLDLVRQENDKSGNRSILKAEHDSSQGEDFVPSDRRLKNIGSTFTAGLDKIRELKVYNYTYKNDTEKRPQVGVIAQDLQKVFPDAVIKDAAGYLKIRRDDIFYAMVNAIKELDVKLQSVIESIKTAVSRLDRHDEEIQILKDEVKSLQAENDILKSQNAAFEKRLEKLEKNF